MNARTANGSDPDTRPAAMPSPAPIDPLPEGQGLAVRCLNLMRVGYAVMGFGLAAVKWPLLGDLRTMPPFEGVMTCLFVALGLLPCSACATPPGCCPSCCSTCCGRRSG
jgi:hypothetical protein